MNLVRLPHSFTPIQNSSYFSLIFIKNLQLVGEYRFFFLCIILGQPKCHKDDFLISMLIKSKDNGK